MKAFALGGGGGKIGFSAGATYRMIEKGIFPDHISGISSGALVGIMLATARYDRMKELITQEVTNDLVYRGRGFRYYWRLGMHKTGLRSPLLGLHNNQPLSDLIQDELYGAHTICDYYTGVVDITRDKFHHVHIPKGSVLADSQWEFWQKAILASTSIPFFFQPVEFGDMLLVDGGVHHHTPFFPLKNAIRDLLVDQIYAVSMLEPYQEQQRKITDDIVMAERVVNGLVRRSAEQEIFTFELINHIANQFGDFDCQGRTYRKRDSVVVRPGKKLNSSRDFNYKNMRSDWQHGVEVVDGLNM